MICNYWFYCSLTILNVTSNISSNNGEITPIEVESSASGGLKKGMFYLLRNILDYLNKN